MLKLAILALTSATGALMACVGTGNGVATSGPAATVAVAVDRDFDLSPGQSATVNGGALTISFTGVPEDSRCPVGVQCIWAGNGKVSLVLTDSSGERSSASLNTTLEPRAIRIGGYEIRLTGLTPDPKQGEPIPPPSYVATLRVVRQ